MALGDQSGKAGDLGRGRSLAVPAFPDDDGGPDPKVRHLLASTDVASVARSLRGARLLASVVAVADAIDASGADKDSHMAVVSMLNERGERGLLAFTGIDSLAAWDPAARPVPALGRDVARSALTDGASAVVVDVMGPARAVFTGTDLLVLADLLDLEAATAAILSALAPVLADGALTVRVQDARSAGSQIDVLVEVVVVPADVPGSDRADQVAALLSAHPDVRREVPGGIAVVSAGSIGA